MKRKILPAILPLVSDSFARYINTQLIPDVEKKNNIIARALRLFLLLISFVSQGQNFPYEKLDSISASISKLQLDANNLVYNDGKESYTLSFPKNNFQIFYSTGKAQKAAKKKKGNIEYLYLTENIEIRKANEISQFVNFGRVGIVRMIFPNGVETQIYKNGVYSNTITEYYLEFFYDTEKSRYFQGQDLIYQSLLDFFKKQ